MFVWGNGLYDVMSMQDSLIDGIFLLRRRKAPVTVGEMFERVLPDRTVAAAKVLSVLKDPLRIPHVRYAVTIKKPLRTNSFREGPRLLALEAFSQAYRMRTSS
tara:strand:- start:55 stop:363 length:309 start_codon:yes stop_codon:yes gene_type:complete